MKVSTMGSIKLYYSKILDHKTAERIGQDTGCAVTKSNGIIDQIITSVTRGQYSVYKIPTTNGILQHLKTLDDNGNLRVNPVPTAASMKDVFTAEITHDGTMHEVGLALIRDEEGKITGACHFLRTLVGQVIQITDRAGKEIIDRLIGEAEMVYRTCELTSGKTGPSRDLGKEAVNKITSNRAPAIKRNSVKTTAALTGNPEQGMLWATNNHRKTGEATSVARLKQNLKGATVTIDDKAIPDRAIKCLLTMLGNERKGEALTRTNRLARPFEQQC